MVHIRRRRLLGAFSVLGALLSSTLFATPAFAEPATTAVKVLSISDFHGRIEFAPSGGSGGAAVLAGAVAQWRAEHPNTIFVSAGDNVGATTFTSFIADDTPTIDVLRASGLEVSAVGNHEFDRGFADLRDRIVPTLGGSALGLGANVYFKGTSTPALAEYAVIEIGGKRIGFIGTVTEQTATSVNPANITEVEFGSQLQAANRVANAIDGLVDATVLLAHDGSGSVDCASVETEQSVFGELIRGASPLIDAIVSGHTHTRYNCMIADRPVIQSGHYGAALGEITLEFDDASGELVSAQSSIVPLLVDGVPAYAADAAVTTIVDDAVEAAEELGGRTVGRIGDSILRGGMPIAEDRAVESALGNLVSDIMLEAVRDEGVSTADLAIMNPGGLRADLMYGTDGSVTYRQVASVLPFANSLFTVQLTGTQLRQLLEQQWYFNGDLELKRHLSVSQGFGYSYLPANPAGTRITAMTLDGHAIEPSEVYTVVTHTFLIAGGDGFSVFTEGQSITDTGLNDLQIAVEYFESRSLVEPPALGRARIDESGGDNPASGEHGEELAATGTAGQRGLGYLGAALLLMLGGSTLLWARSSTTESLVRVS